MLALAFFPGQVSAGVQGTPHDMTRVTGDLFKGPCAYCHVPHLAQGERLWVSTPAGPRSGWGSRTVARLCYSCHNDIGGGMGAVNVTPTAFADAAHGFEVAAAPLAADGSPAVLAALPYVDTGMLDCTTCHDPHSNTPPFLRAVDIDTLCISCHQRSNPLNLGAKNTQGAVEKPFSLHPTDVDYVDVPDNGPTTLHTFPDRLQEPTASGAWRLGAHRAGWQKGVGKIGCQTCHPVHGGWNYLIGLLPAPPYSNLTAIENLNGTAALLCQACHAAGEGVEQVGVGTDHPINTNDGIPATVFPAGWPAGPGGEVTCSSCHDAHGGMPATSLQRQGGNAIDGWCFSCHSVAALLPPYHHSCRQNDDPSVFTSVLTCGDCHGTAAGWTAHNGFEGFKVVVTLTSSKLCEACHTPDDPPLLDAAAYQAATGLGIDFTGAVQPALHGRPSGNDSHLVNEADVDRIANCEIKLTPWDSSKGLSKYGPASEMLCESCHGVLKNSGLLLGSSPAALSTGGWKTNLLLEAYEDNSPGVGIEIPDNVPGVTLSALCRGCHFARRDGVSPSFVHNPEAHTVIDYVYPQAFTPYGRKSTAMLTTPIDSQGPACPEVSSADQTKAPSGLNKGAAPGANSYPANNVMDCDSCHRPHGADSDSHDDGRRRLLEHTNPGQHGTAPCLECHDPDVQCGYVPIVVP